MDFIDRIKYAWNFIWLPEHKEKEILEHRITMHNNYSSQKKKMCIRCKRREAVWSCGQCNTCSDIGFLE